jgi:four helix bundle protein
MRDHKELCVFELAGDLAVLVSRVTARFPKEESYVLTSQMWMAAIPIPFNIVEDWARDSQVN